jgi:PAS domain S-box-containing protein
MHLSKSVGRFLQFSSGEPTMNLLRVVHPRLRTELRTALFRAAASDSVVEVTGIPLEIEGAPKLVDVSVAVMDDLDRDFMLVMFREREMVAAVETAEQVASTSDAHDRDVVQHLEDELDQMRVGWREMVEQYEGSLEELKASNEELQAMNEELRSASEELDTGREELQSINEEVVTINQELKSKVEELSRANSDLQNFMAATRIGTIFIDPQLRIKRFTPSATSFFNLTPTDTGRLLSDITHRLEYPGIINDACRVLDGLPFIEREVRDTSGKYFLARMYPYTVAEGQVNGVVITCVEITERKAEDENRRWLSSIVESVDDAILSTGRDAKILSWNRGAELMFGHSADEAIGQPLAMLSPPKQEDEMADLVAKVISGEKIETFETVCITRDGKLIDVSISISSIVNDVGMIVGATAIVQDISVRKRALEELKQARDELEARVDERTAELSKRVAQLAHLTSEVTLAEQRERKRLSHILHDQLQQLLVAAKLRLESIEDVDEEKRKIEFQRLVDHIDEALVNSRSLAVELSPPILNEGLARAVDWLCATWARENYGLIVERDIDKSVDVPHEDMRILLFLAVKELLFNVVKHSGVQSATLELRRNDANSLRIILRDHGKGLQSGAIPGKDNGSGLGLRSLSERLEMLGGSLEITSKPHDGVTAEIVAPLKKPRRKHDKSH